MNSRRDFLKHGALMAGSALFLPRLLQAMESAPGKLHYAPGLQLYTVRDAMAKDPKGTLARVAEIGYTQVEGATYTGTELYYGMDTKTFSQVLKSNHLVMPSSHYILGSVEMQGKYPKGTILHDWERAVEDAHKVGQKYMVCAFLFPQERSSLDDYKRIAEQFNKAGETCRKAGIQFCYHNHNFEFVKMDGQVPYEVLLAHADKNLVKMEMDIYWVTKAGWDPLALFKEHPGRFELWHVKDMDNTPKQFFTEVGHGIIDFKRIFAHAKEAGMKQFFVEQDICPGNPFDSIKMSLDYLKKNIIA